MNITNNYKSANYKLALSEETTDKILRFWFGDLKKGEVPGSEYRKRW